MRKAFKILAVTTLALTLALPFTAYASQWTQDAMGWKVQADDGIYLTNSWYQSSESGLFYYLGADGYMMVNSTTPDGYQVGADGAWVQPTQNVESTKADPVVQPTQSQPQEQQVAPGALSIEEIERREAEAGMGHNAEGEIIHGIQLDPDAGQGYNWQ